MRMIEPLKPEGNSGDAKTSYSKESPRAYAQGFHDGAYALASEIVATLPDADGFGKIRRADAIALLASYEARQARPCKGWTHEPNKPKQALKLSGIMVPGSTCDLSGHPNPDY